MRVFSGSWEMYQKCGFRSLWAGWGGIMPRQFILAAWAGYGINADRKLELIIGSSTMAQVFLREIAIGAGGMLIAYPLMTACRRVAACGDVVGMSQDKFTGVTQALWKITKNEGVSTLFRGFGYYALAVRGK